MGRSPARPNTSAIRSSRGLRALNGSSGCAEPQTAQAGCRRLAHAELPGDAGTGIRVALTLRAPATLLGVRSVSGHLVESFGQNPFHDRG